MDSLVIPLVPLVPFVAEQWPTLVGIHGFSAILFGGLLLLFGVVFLVASVFVTRGSFEAQAGYICLGIAVGFAVFGIYLVALVLICVIGACVWSLFRGIPLAIRGY